MSKLYVMMLFFVFPVLASDLSDCGNNPPAQRLYQLIKADMEQKRSNIRCNRLLTLTAEAKAKKMADFGLVMHNLGGSPNARLSDAGYQLPEHYGTSFNSNQVEAIAGGYTDADDMWEAFKRSDVHRTHLLGDHEFYMEQDEIGVAFVKELQSPHVEYWVVYLTKGYEKNQAYSGDLNDRPNKTLFILESVQK